MSDHDPILLDLLKHPAWEQLRKRAKDRMELEFHRTAVELMQSKSGIAAEAVQFRRGFFAGMKFLLDQPTLEERKLRRVLEEQGSDE